jgi:hypothetical protein
MEPEYHEIRNRLNLPDLRGMRIVFEVKAMHEALREADRLYTIGALTPEKVEGEGLSVGAWINNVRDILRRIEDAK